MLGNILGFIGLLLNGCLCLQIIRTVKFLCGISVAKYVVTPDWIEKSQQSSAFLGNFLFFLVFVYNTFIIYNVQVL